MAYRIPYQYLAPGAAMMPRANPIPFAQIMENKKFKSKQLDKLTDRQDALLNSMNVMASNEDDAKVIGIWKTKYEEDMNAITDNKKLNTGEKYRKMQLLGNDVRNNKELNAIGEWRDKYEANKKMIEESASVLDEDVSTYAMEELERKNLPGSVGKREHIPNMGYDQWANINPLTTPDLAVRAKEFIDKKIADKSLVDRDGNILMSDGKGGTVKYDGYSWLRADGITQVKEDELMDIAVGYISQAPDIKEWFEQKDLGHEYALRDALAAEGKTQAEIDAEIAQRKIDFGGTVFDKEAYIKAAVDPVAKWGSYTQTDATYLALAKKTPKVVTKPVKIEDIKPLDVYSTTNTGAETEGFIFSPEDKVQFQKEVSNNARSVLDLTAKVFDMEKYREDEAKGVPVNDRRGIPSSAHQYKQAAAQLADAIQKQQSVNAIYTTFEQEEIRKETNAGKAVTLINALPPGSYNNATKFYEPFYSNNGKNQIRVDSRYMPGEDSKSVRKQNIAAGMDPNDPNVFMWNYTWEQYDALVGFWGGGTDRNDVNNIIDIDIPSLRKGKGYSEKQLVLGFNQRGLNNLANVNLNKTQAQKVLRISKGIADLAKNADSAQPGVSTSLTNLQKETIDIFGREGLIQNKNIFRDFNLFSEIVDNAVDNNKMTSEEGQAYKALLPGFEEWVFGARNNPDLKDLYERAVETNQAIANEAFDDYLTETKPTAQTSSDIYLVSPNFEDMKGDYAKDYAAAILKKEAIVNTLNGDKSNFTIKLKDPEPGEDGSLTQAQVKEIIFTDFLAVGMDDKLVGTVQQLPTQFKGYTVDPDNKDNKLYETYIVQGARDENEALYEQIGDLFATPGLQDPGGGRTRLDYAANLARNKDKIGEKFEEIAGTTKRGNFNTQNYYLKTGITDVAMTTPQGYLKDAVYFNPTVKFQKTGSQNFRFQGKDSFPLAAMKQAMEQADPAIKNIFDHLTPKTLTDMLPDVTSGKVDERLFTAFRGLLELKMQDDYYNAKGGVQEFNSMTDAKVWMNNLQNNYIKIFNDLNGPSSVAQIVMAGEGYLKGKRITYKDGEFTVHD